MRVTRLPEVERRPRRVAVGTFDGVHLGHREVIRGADTVLTFDPHPAAVVAPAGAPRLLTTLERKAQLVESLGVDELVVIPFDHDFAQRSAEAFVDDVLVGTLGATHVGVGENFRFGHKARGDAALLAADPRFETRVVPLLEVDGEVVSSSHIRGLVLGGAVEYADRLLGAPFTVIGEVARGDERGRTLGYPTANLVPQDGLVVPGHGVYACRATTPDGTEHVAATNVGVRPMFVTGRGELIEAYLVDFEGDLYGQALTVAFLKRLRGEKRFASVDALVEQMARDVQDARAIAA
ncbi:MAG TPA: bifunctional riboflavin kinase/FAD synthetase [Solirubrobacteraceae bacterium]|nr:bifunctional riboflavin kinase/FAD synthetase [Solirubrobacteraceae bacterium]